MNRKIFGVAILCSFVLVTPILSSCTEAPEIVNLEYTLIFHSDTEPEIEPVTVDYFNLLCLTLPRPEKEGHTFVGWYLDENFTNEYRIDALPNGESNLYAKYEVNQYQITVHTEPEQTFTFNYGEDIAFDVDYGEHYLLKDYYLDEDLTKEFSLKKMPAEDIDLYPSLDYVEKHYSLVFHTGVEEQFDNIDKEYKELFDTLLPTPQKEGYEFDDWYLDEDLTIKYDPGKLSEGQNDLYAKFDETELTLEGKEIVYSSNMLDMEHFKRGKAINPNGFLMDFNGGYTDFIPVKYGDSIIYGDGIKASKYIRYVTAYDAKKRLLPDKGCEDGTDVYEVPHGVCYIRLSLYKETMFADSRINISPTLLKYEPYKQEISEIGEKKRRRETYNRKYRPFTTNYSKQSVDEASYKPLGELSKPYFCLVSDDGLKEEATYSIPMAISKGIPMTLGLMKYSEIWGEPYLTTLRDAVENHGFEVAQHGWTRYTEYTEDQLNCFFDEEKEYFESMGFEPKTAICPAHSISKLVAAVASQRFEALRTGYIGKTAGYKYGYGWYANGPTSNLYALDCINISGEGLSDHKRHIDDACKNNWLMIGFYHENELNDAKKEKIEATIDYAKEKGMEFVTLSEVPHLSERK